MKYHIHSTSKLTLIKLLKRRKLTLNQFCIEQGITTYDYLQNKCIHLGVECPTIEDFNQIKSKHHITDQHEGIIVLDPLPIFKDAENVVLLTTSVEQKEEKQKITRNRKKKEN